MKKALFLLVVCALVGCLPVRAPKPAPGLVYTQVPNQWVVMRKEIPVYVDEKLDLNTKVAIADAVRQWNYVLNGHINLRLVGEGFNMSPRILQQVAAGRGWALLKATPHMLAKPGITELTLAWADKIGGSTVWIAEERTPVDQLPGVVLHELGHLLGAVHAQGIMRSQYVPWGPVCIDELTAKQVAKAQELPPDSVNYCMPSK